MATHISYLNPARIISVARVLSALIFAVFAMTDPVGRMLQAEFDDIMALVYLAYSFLAAAIVWNSWAKEFKFQNIFIVIDIAALMILPIGIEPKIIADLVVSPVLLIICILEICLYLGVKFAINISIIFNVALILVSMSRSEFSDFLQNFFRQVLLTGFISGLILWLGRRGGLSWVPRLKTTAINNRISLFSDICDYAMAVARADGAAVCWEDLEEGAVIHGAGNLASPRSSLDSDNAAIPYLRRSPLLFDLPGVRGLTFSDDGHAAMVALTPDEIQEIAKSGATRGAAVAIPSELLPGWLIINDINGMNCNDLLVVEQIAEEISHAIDRFEVSVTTQQLAQHRLRESIARDLHDGVAQSLAGARFLLVALQRKLELAKQPSADLTPITRALDIEHKHVRDLIDRLRAKEMEFEERNLGAAIAEMADRLAVQWDVEIVVGKTPAAIKISGELAFELKQIIREAIANAVRHGQARQIIIGIQAGVRNLRITVEDDGIGFKGPVPLAMPRTISERVEGLNGLSMVRSQPGATMIQFTIPLEPARD